MLSQIYTSTTLLEGERFVTLSADSVLFAKKTGTPAEAESFRPCVLVVAAPTLLRPFLFPGVVPHLALRALLEKEKMEGFTHGKAFEEAQLAASGKHTHSRANCRGARFV